MQCVELVLVLGLLRADALGAFQHRRQTVVGVGLRRFGRRRIALALDFAQHDVQDRALALEHSTQALVLLGVRVAACFAA